MQIISKAIKDLKPYDKNAKKHNDEQITQIASSLKKFGFKQPIVIDKNNIIVVGHGRFLGAKKLGLESVPCIVADDLSEDEISAYRLADNKLNESDWDFELRDLELSMIDMDMSQFGFDEMIANLDAIDLDAIDLNEKSSNGAKDKVCCCPKCGFEFFI